MKPVAKPRVVRCVARQDGGWLIVPTVGPTAVAASPLEIGARIRIVGGRAEAA